MHINLYYKHQKKRHAVFCKPNAQRKVLEDKIDTMIVEANWGEFKNLNR